MFMGKNNRKNKSNKPKKQNPKSEKSTMIETPKEPDTKLTKSVTPKTKKKEEKCVKSVAEYIKRVEEIVLDNDSRDNFKKIIGRYAFRGLAKAEEYKLVSGAKKEIAISKGGDRKNVDEFEKYLKKVKKRRIY
jgi:hypothetical protein